MSSNSNDTMTTDLTNTFTMNNVTFKKTSLQESSIRIKEDLPNLDGQRFQEQENLGEGGMGVVLGAHDVVLHRDVAIKSLRKDTLWNSREMQYFYREAQITAQLSHPSIVPVYSIERNNNGQPCLIMKKVNGKTLKEYIKECQTAYDNGQVNEQRHGIHERVEIITKICDAVFYAHSKGVVHRDLKPDNIMIGNFEDVYVMDWGVACTIDEDLEELDSSIELVDMNGKTETGSIIGTFTYMPPEQASGSAAKALYSSDQFTIGYMLFEVLTFERARQPTSEEHLMKLALSGEWNENQFSKVTKNLDPRLIAMIRKATEPNPESRYPTVQHLAHDLRRFLHNDSITILPESWSTEVWRQLSKKPLLSLNIVMFIFALSLSFSIHSLQQRLQVTETISAHRQQTADLINHLYLHNHTFEQRLQGITTRVATMAGIVEAEWDSGVLQNYDKSDNCESPHLVKKTVGTYTHPLYKSTWLHWESALCVLKGEQELSLVTLDQPLQNLYFGKPSSDNQSSKEPKDSEVVWAYIGFETGTFMHYPGTAHFQNDFDPRLRPWYVHAGSTAVTCTAPYADLILDNIIIPCTQKIESQNGNTIGVVGVDITLDALSEWMTMKDQSQTPNHFLIHSSGETLLSSSGEELPTSILNQITSSKQHDLIEDAQGVWVYQHLRTQPWVAIYRYDNTIWECEDCFE